MRKMNEEEYITLFSRLPDRELQKERIIVGEGRLVAERMLDCGLEMICLLTTDSLAGHFTRRAGSRCPVIVRPHPEIASIAGYPFHRGVLAAAVRPAHPVLGEYIKKNPGVRKLIICSRLSETWNLGSIARSAAAFGFDSLVLGVGSCDPFSRKALRVSMGAVLSLSMISIGEAAECGSLRGMGIHLYAAGTSRAARPLFDSVPRSPYALVFGNEYEGLHASWIGCCEEELTIPVSGEVDSLNVGVAAGIFLAYFDHNAGR
ncbi:MAG: RNA methyltransferase [Spirochaetales bacterium]|nr:RNA methyltransferase [Spirochaetales bacterium]